jgi:hypothetical protein
MKKWNVSHPNVTNWLDLKIEMENYHFLFNPQVKDLKAIAEKMSMSHVICSF